MTKTAIFSVSVEDRVKQAIAWDATGFFVRVPGRGAETGGILLGRREADRVVVEDFVPVPCEHRFGRLYKLSAQDRQALRDALDAARDPRRPLAPVGFYRSNARETLEPEAEDRELLEAHFPEERVLLLVQPNLSEEARMRTYVWPSGDMADAPAEPIPPAPVPVMAAAEPAPPGRNWLAWAIATTLVAGAAGMCYYVLLKPAAVEPVATRPATAPIPATAPPPAAPTPPPVVAETAPPPPVSPDTNIRAILDRWTAAVRRGAVEEASLLYVSGQARESARDRFANLLKNQDSFEVFRLDQLEVKSAAPDTATAAFRLRWQLGGFPKTTGEERVSLTLRNIGGQWRIAGERVESPL